MFWKYWNGEDGNIDLNLEVPGVFSENPRTESVWTWSSVSTCKQRRQETRTDHVCNVCRNTWGHRWDGWKQAKPRREYGGIYVSSLDPSRCLIVRSRSKTAPPGRNTSKSNWPDVQKPNPGTITTPVCLTTLGHAERRHSCTRVAILRVLLQYEP